MPDYRELDGKNGFALAPDLLLTGEGPIADAVLAVADGTIIHAGPRREFTREAAQPPIIELPGKAIIPGLIDAHLHLGQGFGKALTGGEPAQIWRRIWAPLEGNLDPHTSYLSAKWMLLEALRGGFTGVVNFAILSDAQLESVHQAAAETGIRLVSATGAAEPTDLPGKSTTAETTAAIDAAIVRGERHLQRCKGLPRITPSLCVPGVQAASGAMIEAISGFCADNGALFQIHTNEHHVEVHWSVDRYGKRPLEFFADHGGIGPHTLHHHCTLVTDSEIEILRDSRSGVSYNPLASIWKGDRVAPALGFAARDVRMGIGTDSTRLDGLRLLESAETCQRLASGMSLADFSCGAAWTWIDAATGGSADVAGLGAIAGELIPSRQADFLVLDRERPEVLPSWDFEWELVRLYNRDQIEAVFVDGGLVMENGQPTGWDLESFVNDHRDAAAAAVRSAPLDRKHGVSSRYRPKSGRAMQPTREPDKRTRPEEIMEGVFK